MCTDSTSCTIQLTSQALSAGEDDGTVTVCLELFAAQLSVSVSVQLETVTGVGTATGIKTVYFFV